MLSVTHLLIIAHIVVFAVTFCDLITRKKMILWWYGELIDRLETKPRFGWIAYLLGYCAKCMAGQIALWVFLYRAFVGWEPMSLVLIRGIVFVCSAVLTAEVGSKWLGRLSR